MADVIDIVRYRQMNTDDSKHERSRRAACIVAWEHESSFWPPITCPVAFVIVTASAGDQATIQFAGTAFWLLNAQAETGTASDELIGGGLNSPLPAAEPLQ